MIIIKPNQPIYQVYSNIYFWKSAVTTIHLYINWKDVVKYLVLLILELLPVKIYIKAIFKLGPCSSGLVDGLTIQGLL